MAFKRSAVRSRLSPPTESSEILGFRNFFFLSSAQMFVVSSFGPLEWLLFGSSCGIPFGIRNIPCRLACGGYGRVAFSKKICYCNHRRARVLGNAVSVFPRFTTSSFLLWNGLFCLDIISIQRKKILQSIAIICII